VTPSLSEGQRKMYWVSLEGMERVRRKRRGKEKGKEREREKEKEREREREREREQCGQGHQLVFVKPSMARGIASKMP
jgi:hypothetical protein